MFSFLLWKSFGNDFYYRFIKSFSTFGIIWLRENTKYVIKWYSHFLVALRHAKYGQNSDISIVLIKVDVCDVKVPSYTAATWSSIFGDIAWKLTGSFDICLRLAIHQPLHAVIGWKLVVKQPLQKYDISLTQRLFISWGKAACTFTVPVTVSILLLT